MPKRAPEKSETELNRLLADSKRTKLAQVTLGGIKGLVMRVSPGKQDTAPVYLAYRSEVQGQVRWLPLGFYPEKSLAELHSAAAEARAMKADPKDPKDPIEERQKALAEAKAAKAAAIDAATKTAKAIRDAPKMQDACNLYFTYSADRSNVKESTARWAKAVINRLIVPYWGERLVSSVTKDQIKDWHRSEAVRAHPAQADAALRLMSKIFTLTSEKGWRTDNPASRLPKLVRGAAKRRERILNKEERKALARALTAMERERTIDPAAAGAIRTMLLTAMRLTETLSLTWDAVDFQSGWITLKDHKSSSTAGDKPVCITPQLKLLLEAQPRRTGCNWVFPSPITPPPPEELGHFVGLQKVWERVRERVTADEAELVNAKMKKEGNALNIEDVHLHDLRRTALSITFGDVGQSLTGLSKVAGHASVSTTEKIYTVLERDKLRVSAELIATAMASDLAEGKTKRANSKVPITPQTTMPTRARTKKAK